MACNCSKKRKPPHGMAKPAPTGSAAERKTAAAEARQTPTIRTSTTGRRQSFALETRDGRTESFGSRLEAEAARIRAGGGIIRAR